jgi:two-component sensor histidine kinase
MNRKPEDLDVWGYDVDTSDFIVRGDPETEISDKVYEELELKINELISGAVSYAIQNSLKGAIDIRKRQ